MESREDILKELNEIAPKLAKLEKANNYQLPEGYFMDFNARLQQQLKPVDVRQELAVLAPSLARLSKPANAEVEAGYFSAFSGKIIHKVRTEDVAKELAIITPLLSGLKKVNTLQAPVNYFNSFADRALGNITAEVDAPVTGTNTWVDGLNVFLDGLVNAIFKPKYTIAFAGMATTAILAVMMFVKIEQTDNLDYQFAQVSTADIDNYLDNKSDAYSDEVFEMNLDTKGVNDSAASIHPYRDALKNVDDAALDAAIAD